MNVGMEFVSRNAKRGTEEAAVVGERLALIEEQNGALRAEDVVADAKSNNSPLHRYFEWDDTEAARAHRLWQARSLIGRYYVRHVEQPEAKPVRAWVNLRPTESDPDQRYENIVTAMSDEEKRRRVMYQAMRELRSWQNRYADLKEFSDVFSAIDKLPPGEGE